MHYLVVANQTAASDELMARLQALGRDRNVEFTLLVPAADRGAMTWTEGASRAAAIEIAEAARVAMQARSLRVSGLAVGDPSPLDAIADELRERPGVYDGIVICTLPPGRSRWLGMDVHTRAERRFKLPIEHVIANSVVRRPAAVAASAASLHVGPRRR